MSYKLIHGDCAQMMEQHLQDSSIDLTVTSPPYDNLRTYNGFTFDFEAIARQLYRVTKPGGVVVWVVGDKSENHSESLTSFKQACFFVDIARFNLLDTMIYKKSGATYRHNHLVYPQSFEYMFVLSKGKPKTFNPIIDKKNTQAGKKITGTVRNNNGTLKPAHNMNQVLDLVGMRDNVWTYNTGFMNSTSDKNAFEHPAIFPEALAKDHILSWSNPGDLVLDPFVGSGTTGKMALFLQRDFIGIDVSSEYLEIARDRIEKATYQPSLFTPQPTQWEPVAMFGDD